MTKKFELSEARRAILNAYILQQIDQGFPCNVHHESVNSADEAILPKTRKTFDYFYSSAQAK